MRLLVPTFSGQSRACAPRFCLVPRRPPFCAVIWLWLLMDIARIAALLEPFLPTRLADAQLNHILMYIDILIRWNARINLTAVRAPEEIVTRHFGESLFAARHLFPDASGSQSRVIDVGSGAGFPGLPIKIWAPAIHLTLIESNHKKATFLREAIRRLAVTDTDVFHGRAEQFVGLPKPTENLPTDPSRTSSVGDVVTMRAVEHFASALPVAANLVAAGGRLALLIGSGQVEQVYDLAPAFNWQEPIPIPLAASRVFLLGSGAPG
jgi:16S rRNA (guanine527-N7)-methyltransferase